MVARRRLTSLAKSLVGKDAYEAADRNGKDAYRMYAVHLQLRAEQKHHEAFEDTGDGVRDGVFLTVKRAQLCLQRAGAKNTGTDAARAARRFLLDERVLEDTGQVKMPRHQPKGDIKLHGVAQTNLEHTYWWPVYRVPGLTRLQSVLRRFHGAYGQGTRLDVSQDLVSLSRFVGCQVLKRKKRKGFTAVARSRQWEFQHYGPP